MGRGAQGEAEEKWVDEGEGEIEIEEEDGVSGSGAGQKGLFLADIDIDQDAGEWTTFGHFPVATQGVFNQVFNKMLSEGREELTVLLLGKNGVGKSSTVNHVIGERKQKVNPYGVSTIDKPTAISRTRGEFTLTLIDTPGIVIGDRIHEATLNTVADIARETQIDVVLYVDRLDVYDVSSLDVQIFESITRVLGQDLWQNTLLVLTHGELEPPKGQTYADFVKGRAERLVESIQRASGDNLASANAANGDSAGAVVIENSSKCNRNWSSERILPDGTVVLPNLMQKMAELATNALPYEYNPRGKSADSKHKWLIPFCFAAQVLLKHFVFDKAVKQWDTYHGDEWGPKQQEYKDDKYMQKMKEAKREYRRRQKAKQEAREA
mmetsp:Transcript_15524/g.39471  ORF Transcript_15524/g.39471 Transcript_15524/m.39471 type:complete len:380 (-) Transcript_15524:159-1298(-)